VRTMRREPDWQVEFAVVRHGDCDDLEAACALREGCPFHGRTALVVSVAGDCPGDLRVCLLMVCLNCLVTD
jgi:hypothetical protein